MQDEQRKEKMSKRRAVFFWRETMRKERRWNLRWFFFSFCLWDFTQRLQFSWLPEMLVEKIRKNRILVFHPSLDPITRRQTDRSSSWRKWGTTGRKWMREEMERERKREREEWVFKPNDPENREGYNQDKKRGRIFCLSRQIMLHLLPSPFLLQFCSPV